MCDTHGAVVFKKKSKMKLLIKAKQKKKNINSKEKDDVKKFKLMTVAYEFQFARLLSGNEKKSRDRVLKTLKKWLTNCFQKGYDFKEEDFSRLWKGFFYAVWMSDKPLVQEELCENIAGILDLFPVENFRHAVLMTKAGLQILATDWFGLDQHRIDKFMMLVRRCMRAIMRCLKRSDWSVENCILYAKMLSNTDGILAVKTPQYAVYASSMIMHYVDCFLEELSKVSQGELPEPSLVELLRPFIVHMARGQSPCVVARCRRLLTALLRQSELGLRYQDATRAWQQVGCPEGGPEALQLVSDDEDEGAAGAGSDDEQDPSERPLDPRAGHVDVELNPLPVPAEAIAAVLRDQLRSASSAAHTRVKICMQRFERLGRQEYPLPLAPRRSRGAGPAVPAVPAVPAAPAASVGSAAARLLALDAALKDGADELALRGLSKKSRKRILAMSRAGVNIVEELERSRQKAGKGEGTKTTSGDWQVEEAPVAKRAKITEKKESKENGRRLEKKLKTSVINKREEKGKKDNRKKVKGVLLNGSVEKNKKSSAEPKTNMVVTDTKVSKKMNMKPEKTVNINNLGKNKQKSNPNVMDIKTQNGKKGVKHVNGVKKVEKDTKPSKNSDKPTLLVNKVKSFQKSTKERDRTLLTPKRVQFVLKNNSMQGAVDYYKSVRQSPNIPYNPSVKPSKTNLKPSTPSPINPFFKKKLKLK